MDAPNPGSAEFVALRPFKVGERNYQPADNFLRDTHLQRGHLTERQLASMENQALFAPLSRHTYSIAAARRAAGTGIVGKGFTPGYLVERGIIDAEAAKAAEPKKPKVAVDPTAPQAGEAIDYKGCKIACVTVGNFKKFEVTNAAGDLLRPERFTKVETAKKFVDSIHPDEPESTDKSGSDTASGSSESQDGGNIQT